jgi:predicted TIM-barrel fold metal-dependent hydrolase
MPLVIDADAHVLEGPTFFSEALKRWPEKLGVSGGERPAILVEGRPYPETEGPGAGCPPRHAVCTAPGIDPSSPQGVVADAESEGIDRMVLFPSFGLGIPGFRDGRFATEIADFYNTWVVEWCAPSGDRLYASAVLPVEEVGAAIGVLTRARKRGLVCATLPPALRDRNLDHPELDPLWAAAVDLDIPVAVHGAPGVHLPKIGVDRFHQYVQVHCVSFPFDMMTAMTAIVSGGVLERHPRLRVGFLESGVGWVPYFLDRLGEHFEKRGDWIANGWKRPPREYLERGQIFASCEPGEPLLPATIANLGDAFILYASDYPHWDSEFPESSRKLRDRQDLGPEARAAILGGNAQRFFAIS